jgi:hypothetical protein
VSALVDLSPMPPTEAEAVFLARFAELAA